MPKSGRSATSKSIAPLSSRERLILAEWKRARISRVTRIDVAGRWGAAKADKITSALVRKGALNAGDAVGEKAEGSIEQGAR